MRTYNLPAALTIAGEYWRKRIAATDIAGHPVTKGDTLEHAWRDLLGEYLPDRYKVTSGFVISVDHQISDQIDCIVYDGMYTPTFFGEHRLAYIPAEGVYAAFEIKPRVNKRYIEYAIAKIKSVRALPRTSAPYVVHGKAKSAKKHFDIIGGLLARDISNWGRTKKILDEYKESKEEALDCVFTANGGGADYFKRGRPNAELTIFNSSAEAAGIIKGAIRLIMALQGLGTVAAMNWKDWLNNLPE